MGVFLGYPVELGVVQIRTHSWGNFIESECGPDPDTWIGEFYRVGHSNLECHKVMSRTL